MITIKKDEIILDEQANVDDLTEIVGGLLHGNLKFFILSMVYEHLLQYQSEDVAEEFLSALDDEDEEGVSRPVVDPFEYGRSE